MPDIFGRTPSVGDTVAVRVPNRRGLMVSTITKITPKGIKVEYPNHYNPTFFVDDGMYAIKADVAPVRRGRWLCVETDTEQFFLCDQCKHKEYWESNFCPHCGSLNGGEHHAQ